MMKKLENIETEPEYDRTGIKNQEQNSSFWSCTRLRPIKELENHVETLNALKISNKAKWTVQI